MKARAYMIVLEILKAVLYGILEGVTEWLPISSTGHIILLSELLPLDFSRYGEKFSAEFFEMFEVVIQLGAIAAVAWIFFGRLNPFCRKNLPLWTKIIVACIPAAALGIIFQIFFEELLNRLYNPVTVAVTLIGYGVLFIAVERGKKVENQSLDAESIGYGRAFAIGCFQALSIIPGTSRSGATVLGARCLGVSRVAAAEFSFFMAVPTMLGASGIKSIGFIKYLLESGESFPAECAVILAAAMISAFAVSLAAIKFLMSFVSKRGFAPFGVYRIILGIAVIAYFGFLKK